MRVFYGLSVFVCACVVGRRDACLYKQNHSAHATTHIGYTNAYLCTAQHACASEERQHRMSDTLQIAVDLATIATGTLCVFHQPDAELQLRRT